MYLAELNPHNQLHLYKQGFLITRAIKNNPDTLFIQDCYVLPKYRKQGHAKRWIKSLNKNLLSIVPMDNNTRNESIYAQLKAGFKIINAVGGDIWLKYEKQQTKT